LPVLGLVVLLAVVGGAAWAWLRSRDTTPNVALYTTTLNGTPAALAVDGRTGRVFVTVARGPGAGGAVLDEATGAMLDGQAIPASALAVDERAGTVIASGPAGVTMLDAANGRYLRTIPTGVTPSAVAVDTRTDRAFVVDEGSNAVFMLDTRSGAVVGARRMLMTPALVAVDATTDQAFVTTDSPFVDVLDTHSGALVRTAVLRASGGPLLVDGGSGHIFVLAPGGASVTMLDRRSGLVLRTIPVGQFPVAIALDPRRGRVYVASRDSASSFNPTNTGSLSVIDARSGAVLRTIPVGVDPMAVAVDPESGRVFVATRGGASEMPDAWRWVPGWLRDRLPFLPPPGPHLRVSPPAVTALTAP
jgi:YVTN family beta-propeller protein